MNDTRCPRCADRPAWPGQDLSCREGHRFASWHGIPDLRVAGDAYLTTADDLSAASRIAGGGVRSWREMLAAYYQENAKVPPEQAARFVQGVAAAEERAAKVLGAWLEMTPGVSVAGSRWLDVGCGTAPLAIAVARAGGRVVGVDAGMRWLAIADARCREAGVEVELVCANVQGLPFASGSVDVVAGESVIEHVLEQPDMLAEVHRVLRPRGACLLSMPNRLFPGPDPHVGLLAGGWFPDAFVARYARRRGMVPPRRILHSSRSIAALLHEAGFEQVRIGLPDLAAAQLRGGSSLLRLGAAGYGWARRTPGVRDVLRLIAPTLLVSAVRR